MGCDLIYIELVKIAENQLAESHTCIINSVTTQSVFANKAKEASVTPVDKGGNDKHTFSKYRPVSVLNTFSKISGLSIFDQITICANEFLSAFINTACFYTFTQEC